MQLPTAQGNRKGRSKGKGAFPTVVNAVWKAFPGEASGAGHLAHRVKKKTPFKSRRQLIYLHITGGGDGIWPECL